MNSIKNFGLKFALMLIALFSMNYAVAQQVNLSIPNQVVNSYEPFDLQIFINDNVGEFSALQFEMTLDKDLEWADGENTDFLLNYDILTKGVHKASVSIDGNTARVVLKCQDPKVTINGNGELMTVPLKVRAPYTENKVYYDQIENGAKLDVTLSDIVFSTGDGSASIKQKETAFVDVVWFEPFKYNAYLSSSVEPFAIYPSTTQAVDFCLDNIVTVNPEKAAPVLALTVMVTLPEGLSIENIYDITPSNRLFGRTAVDCRDRGNGNYFFMLYDDAKNEPLKAGISTGSLFSFNVTASEDFTGDPSSIKVSDLEISAIVDTEAVKGDKVQVEDFTIAGWYAANEALYNAVVEQINALQEQVNAAIAQVKEENPEFNTAEWDEMFGEQFKLMNDGAKQALEAAKEDRVVYSFLIDNETIDGMVDEMRKAALADSELRAANEASYKVIIAVLDEVQAQYEAALAQLKEEYPAVDFSEFEEMISGQIEEQRNGAAQALASANEDGVEFSYPFDNGEYILTMVEEMKNYAKASADQAALEAANAEACNAVLASIDAAQAEFEAAAAEVKESYPDFEVSEYEEIVMGMLNQAREGATQALAAANEDGVEFAFAFSDEDVQAIIAEMKSVAAREAANEAAYNEVIATIDSLKAEYEAAVAEIKEKDAEFDFSEWDQMILGSLDQAAEGAAQALATANEDGTDFVFPYDGEDIKSMIEEMKNSAEGSAVSAIEAEVAAGKAMIFTLDGKQHNRPVVGEVNVIVRENSVTKIVIK